MLRPHCCDASSPFLTLSLPLTVSSSTQFPNGPPSNHRPCLLFGLRRCGDCRGVEARILKLARMQTEAKDPHTNSSFCRRKFARVSGKLAQCNAMIILHDLLLLFLLLLLFIGEVHRLAALCWNSVWLMICCLFPCITTVTRAV